MGAGWTVVSTDTTTREHWKREYEIRDVRLRELGFNSYWAYRSSADYMQRRAEARAAADGACAHCDATGMQLDIHHRTYERLGRESAWDLIALCPACHAAAHGRAQAEQAA
jgi:5-methylcytosine-specific restriction endonuclease McrA